MNNKSKTQKIVIAALFAALIAVATMISFPSPLGGYINMGDCIILIAAWLLSPIYGALAAAIGSATADMLLGYVSYAPATFVIKAIVALVACGTFKVFLRKSENVFWYILSAVIAEFVMIVLYYIFESAFLYGFVASMANVVQNSIQALANSVAGVVLISFFRKNKIFK